MAEKADKYAKLAFVLMASDSMSSVLKQAADNANGSLSKIEQDMARFGQSALRVGTHMNLIGKQITSSVFNIVKEAADYGDASAKTARAVGLQTEEWQKLAYAAEFAGVSHEELQSSMNKFNKFINAATSGSKKELQIFNDLGVRLKDASGALRPQQEIFKDFSEIFSQVGESATKSALEMELFGKSGGKLATLLDSGRESIEAMGDEAERLGLVFDGKKWEELKDSMLRVNKAFLGTKLQIADALSPAIEKTTALINIAIEKVTKWTSEHKGLTKVIAIAVAGLGGLLLVMGTAGMVIGGTIYSVLQITRAFRLLSSALHLKQIGLFIKDLVTVRLKTLLQAGASKIAAASQWVHNAAIKAANMGRFITGLVIARTKQIALAVAQKAAAAAQWLLNAAMSANPIGLIIAGVAALIAGIVLLIKNWDKVSAFFVKLWDKIKQAFSAAWEWIKNLFLNYTPYGLIIKHWDKISAWFANLWKKIKETFAAWSWVIEIPVYYIKKLWGKIKEWFAGLWDKVKNVFSTTWDWIKNLLLKYTPLGLVAKHWDAIKDWFAELWDKVKNVFSEKWAVIGEFFSGLKDRFFDWGKNLLQGLIDGITEMINKPLDMIKNLGENLGTKFKSKLGINSPSRLFMEYGINITKGLTGGIDYGLPAVASSSGSMAMQAITGYGKSFQVNMERVTPVSLPVFNYEKSEPVYTRLQQSFEQPDRESNIIPASQIFNNSNYSNQTNQTNQSNYNTESRLPISYAPVINIYGNPASEETKQDFSRMLRDNYKEFEYLIKRYFSDRERLSFNS